MLTPKRTPVPNDIPDDVLVIVGLLISLNEDLVSVLFQLYEPVNKYSL